MYGETVKYSDICFDQSYVIYRRFKNRKSVCRLKSSVYLIDTTFEILLEFMLYIHIPICNICMYMYVCICICLAQKKLLKWLRNKCKIKNVFLIILENNRTLLQQKFTSLYGINKPLPQSVWLFNSTWLFLTLASRRVSIILFFSYTSVNLFCNCSQKSIKYM